MNQRIDRTGPSVGHHGAVGPHGTAGASPRFNAAAAFRALLGMVRSQGALTDKKARRASSTAGVGGRGGSHSGVEIDEAVEASSSNQGGGRNGQRRGTSTDKNWTDKNARRGSSTAGGVARGRGGSHLVAETDEAVEGSSSNQGGGGGNHGQRRARPGGGATSEGAAPKSSLFFTTLTARDAGPGPAFEPISTASQPLVWPAAKLPGAWQRVDSSTSAYVPASDFVDRTSAQARPAESYMPWTPLAGGDAVLPAARRWGRAASVLPYALPLAFTAPRIGSKRYRSFTPLLRPAEGTVSTVSPRLRPGSWFAAATVRPFVSPVIFAKAPIQRVKYRPFTRLSLVAGTGSATPDKPGHRPRAAAIPPYRPAGIVAAQTRGSRKHSYTPPHRFDGIDLRESQKRGAGEMRLPMSIDTLVNHFRLDVGVRPLGHRGG
jgi:hypothetical protein